MQPCCAIAQIGIAKLYHQTLGATNMTAQETLHQVMQQRNWYASLAISRSLAGEYKRNLAKGKLSYEKTCELLQALGYSKIKEEVWAKKNAHSVQA